jgi:hypothetical protein
VRNGGWVVGLLVVGLAFPAFAAKERNLDQPRDGKGVRAEPTVTMDVKDMETRKILKEVQAQCGMKNLIVDPDVKDEQGTFKLNKVSCSTALKVILRSLRLDSVTYSNSLVNVTRKQ